MKIRKLIALASCLGATTLLANSAISAQGTLSGLGFGYPVGGVSIRAGGTAGSFGEFDAASPRNPASIGGLQSTLLAAQTEPEFRTLSSGGVKENTSTQRVPLLLVGLPIRRGIAVSLSGSTFLDRNFSTVTTGTAVIDGASYTTVDRSDVRGSIADLRGAVGWRPNARLSFGIAGHLLTGDNVAVTSRGFSDTTQFGSVSDSSRVTYYGKAVSVGADVQLRGGIAAAASFRAGGSFEATVGDSAVSKANVPDRLGVNLRYDGIPGAIFSVGVEQVMWSQMGALGSSAVQSHDATNWSVGGEAAGPSLLGAPTQVRVGYARNRLPFGVNNRRVNESRFSGGFGVPLANSVAALDFSIQRANRSLEGGLAKESAWLFGFGLQIRPSGP